jgi:hypothetical protein
MGPDHGRLGVVRCRDDGTRRRATEEGARIHDAFLEEERVALPSWVYRQEYECSFEETEDQVFTTEMVERAVTSEVKAATSRRSV